MTSGTGCCAQLHRRFIWQEEQVRPGDRGRVPGGGDVAQVDEVLDDGVLAVRFPGSERVFVVGTQFAEKVP